MTTILLKKIPSFIVHYSRSEPFRSMTSVPSGQWADIIKDLDDSTTWGKSRFLDSQYLSQRLEVEERIRKEFISKGGTPELKNPIYFFLGRHSRFEEHKSNRGYIIYLKDILSEHISFTYGDSMLGYNEENRALSGEKYRNQLCAKIFLKEELPGLFVHNDFSKSDQLSIEVQLWTVPSKKIVKNLGSLLA